MVRLLVNGVEVALAEVAADAKARTKGLLGRSEFGGDDSSAGVSASVSDSSASLSSEVSASVLVLEPAAWISALGMWIHTFGIRFAIDVAYVDRRGKVLAVTTMKPWRIGTPRLRARKVLEATAGSFAKWNLRVGDTVEIVS